MSYPTTDIVPVDSGTFDLARTDGVTALKHAEGMVRYMADKCKGPQFISVISGRKYPRVEWWCTVGAGLGLFPQELSSNKLDREVITYEAIVEVRRGEQVISRASALCSASEKTWKSRDEYAIKSMATTRATGKAYRIAFSFLAVMAGLEPTPAEEMPPEPESPATGIPAEEIEFLKDDLLTYLDHSKGVIAEDAANKLREAVVRREKEDPPQKFAEFLRKALNATVEEVKKQEALLAANTNPMAAAVGKLEQAAKESGKVSEGAKQGEMYDHP